MTQIFNITQWLLNVTVLLLSFLIAMVPILMKMILWGFIFSAFWQLFKALIVVLLTDDH
ncbi:hypothetical protein [Enterococcus sp. AZ196]|uniref:hypothetical protein n=1 Tax=Enterococcus sp. AZ196 TaxID=2774659 RepID=UPI003D296E73